MTISRSTFLTATASALALARGTALAADPVAMTVGTIPTSDLLPVFVAKDQGFYAKRGLDVTIQILPVAPTIVGAIRGGSIAFGALTGPALVLANQGGLDLVAAVGAVRESRKDPRTSVVARTGSTIKEPADFVGKRVGVPGISSVLDIMFRYWLSQNKVDPKSVNIVEAPFATMPDQLKSGALEAVCTAEPFRSLIINSGAGYRVANYFADVHDNLLGLAWCSTREWAQKNPAPVTAFRASLADSIAFIVANPAAARQTESKWLKLPAPTLAKFDLSLAPADFAYYGQVLQSLGMLHEQVDASKDLL
jgi:NitT/TauT family transport system substrate-binding protein